MNALLLALLLSSCPTWGVRTSELYSDWSERTVTEHYECGVLVYRHVEYSCPPSGPCMARDQFRHLRAVRGRR